MEGAILTPNWKTSSQQHISKCDRLTSCDRREDRRAVSDLRTQETELGFQSRSLSRCGRNVALDRKRGWTDQQWQEYATAPELRTFGAYYDSTLAGYYELRQDEEGGVEIAYFGLLPEFFGRGFGGALLTSAIEEAWRSGACGPSRLGAHLHTRSSTCVGQLPGPRICDLQSGSGATENPGAVRAKYRHKPRRGHVTLDHRTAGRFRRWRKGEQIDIKQSKPRDLLFAILLSLPAREGFSELSPVRSEEKASDAGAPQFSLERVMNFESDIECPRCRRHHGN